MGFLEVSSVSIKEGNTVALKSISLTQKKLQKLAIAGETGSGKSTLLKIIAGIVSPHSGQVVFEGTRLKRIPEEKLIPGHPGIAYLSQQFELPHFLTVEQVLIYANTLPDDEAENDEETRKLYNLCHITHLLKRKTHQLSGGERQRIALAKLLVARPRLLLLDEPFSNLDMIHKSILKKVLHDVEEQLQVSCILVSHDPLDTLSWADEIIIMQEGEILQQGTPQKLYNNPVNTYVAGLLGKYNLITPKMAVYIPGLESIAGNKSVFVRPENIMPETEDTPLAFRATVSNIYFFGSYYEIDILVADAHTLTMRATKFNLPTGAEAVFALQTSGLRFM